MDDWRVSIWFIVGLVLVIITIGNADWGTERTDRQKKIRNALSNDSMFSIGVTMMAGSYFGHTGVIACLLLAIVARLGILIEYVVQILDNTDQLKQKNNVEQKTDSQTPTNKDV